LTGGAPARARRLLVPAALLLFFAVRGFCADLNAADEAWFHQVLTRVAGGEALYRDVYLGTTPLSVYLGVGANRLAGGEIWGMRALAVLLALATACLTLGIVREALGRDSRVLPLALAAWAAPLPNSLYSTLGTALFLLTARLALAGFADPATRPRWAGALPTGAAAGLCFAAKQNYGALALGALLLCLALRPRAPGRRVPAELLAALAGFAGAAGLLLLPLAAAGLWPWFVDCAIAGKGAYLREGGASYLAAVARTFDLEALARSRSLQHAQSATLAPAVALALVALALARARRDARRPLLALGAFLAGAVAGVYPRADLWHVHYAVPLALAAGAVGATRLPALALRPLRWAALVFFVVGVALPAASLARSAAAGELVLCRLPHFRGIWIDAGQHRALEQVAADLRLLAPAERTFLLCQQAGFFYLLTGLRNPTRFDYPLVSAFGRTGLRDLEAELRTGGGPDVAILQVGRDMWPDSLEATVRSHLHPAGRAGPWELFRSDGPGGPR